MQPKRHMIAVAPDTYLMFEAVMIRLTKQSGRQPTQDEVARYVLNRAMLLADQRELDRLKEERR